MTYVVVNTLPSRKEAGVGPADLPVGANCRGDELRPDTDPELLDRRVDSGMVVEAERVKPLYDTFQLFI
jgi:hypothetical protein